MITAITAILAKYGFGWVFSWLSGGVFSSMASVITAALTQALDVAGILLKWIATTLISGAEHLIKSVPAMLLVLSLSWAAYGYGKYVAPVEMRVVERKAPSPSIKKQPDAAADWMRKVWGN